VPRTACISALSPSLALLPAPSDNCCRGVILLTASVLPSMPLSTARFATVL